MLYSERFLQKYPEPDEVCIDPLLFKGVCIVQFGDKFGDKLIIESAL